MQDRYLFRGKRIDNGEWVKGNLIYSNDAEVGYEAIIIPTNDSNMYTKGGSIGDLGFENWHRVNETTICQCTGLKDKNGKLIWENDIVKHYNDDAHPEGYCTGTVLWDENYAGFYRTSNEYGLSKPRISSDCIYEVVGNVFDDTKLLEE